MPKKKGKKGKKGKNTLFDSDNHDVRLAHIDGIVGPYKTKVSDLTGEVDRLRKICSHLDGRNYALREDIKKNYMLQFEVERLTEKNVECQKSAITQDERIYSLESHIKDLDFQDNIQLNTIEKKILSLQQTIKTLCNSRDSCERTIVTHVRTIADLESRNVSLRNRVVKLEDKDTIITQLRNTLKSEYQLREGLQTRIQVLEITQPKSEAETEAEAEPDVPNCVVCMEKPRNTVFFPCRHSSMCDKCDLLHSEKGNGNCPICSAVGQSESIELYNGSDLPIELGPVLYP